MLRWTCYNLYFTNSKCSACLRRAAKFNQSWYISRFDCWLTQQCHRRRSVTLRAVVTAEKTAQQASPISCVHDEREHVVVAGTTTSDGAAVHHRPTLSISLV